MIDLIRNMFVGRAYADSIFKVFGGMASTSLSNTGNATTTLENVTTTATTWILGIAGLIAFFYLIIAGINYITAGGDTTKANTARQAIIHAIIGIVVIVAAWFIINFGLQLGHLVTNNQ